MLELTGVLAVILVFLSGPYRTLQKRSARRWGPVLSVWAHTTISIGAAAAVFLHLLLLDDAGFDEGSSASVLNGTSFTWLATLLFATSAAVGVTSLFTSSAQRRQRWLALHRRVTWLFYLAIIPHVFGEGVLGWAVVLLALAGWGIAHARPRLRATLSRPDWPRFGRWGSAGSSRLPRVTAASLAVLLPLAIGALGFAAVRTPGGDAQLELTGTIAEMHEHSISLETDEGSVSIRVSDITEMETDVGLAALLHAGTVISVGVAQEEDGPALATEVELA